MCRSANACTRGCGSVNHESISVLLRWETSTKPNCPVTTPVEIKDNSNLTKQRIVFRQHGDDLLADGA